MAAPINCGGSAACSLRPDNQCSLGTAPHGGGTNAA